MNIEYQKLISAENIFAAWRKFASGKTGKKDVLEFWRNLEDNIFSLHKDLAAQAYKHSDYEKFIVCDPKKRLIHKARARDRIVHRIIFDYLQPIFEKRFIFDSYSSRTGKGTHRAVKRLKVFCRSVSQNNTEPCWILKGDIEKFFDSVSHNALFNLIKKRVDKRVILELIWRVIKSYEILPGRGLPLGNLTSQLFANIYLNELDYFIKNIMRLKYYIRFNDDFVIVHQNKEFLNSQIPVIQKFLSEKLALVLPDNKISLRKFSWGIDFLGYIILPQGVLLRTKTKKRIARKIKAIISDFNFGKIPFNKLSQTLSSYLGVLKHCSAFKLKQAFLNLMAEQ
jgi:retron-type reverse transcriptase